MKAPITFAIAGFGDRGSTYASMQKLFPDRMKVVAVADINPEKVQKAKELYGIKDELCFTSAEEMLAQDKLADVMGILWKKTKFTPVFIGVCGAFGHNLAQLLVALWMTGFGALGYTPALALYSVVCGICTGLLLQVLLPLLEKLPVLRK